MSGQNSEENDPFREIRHLPPPVNQTGQIRYPPFRAVYPPAEQVQMESPGNPLFVRVRPRENFNLLGYTELEPYSERFSGVREYRPERFSLSVRPPLPGPYSPRRPGFIPEGMIEGLSPLAVNSPRPEHRVLVPASLLTQPLTPTNTGEPGQGRNCCTLHRLGYQPMPYNLVREYAIHNTNHHAFHHTAPFQPLPVNPRSKQTLSSIRDTMKVFHNRFSPRHKQTAPAPTPTTAPTSTPAPTLAPGPAPEPAAVETEFEEMTAHTAKCDLCNTRNDLGMSRCLTCGWQSCHACTVANGCLRTHTAGGRVHTGPIDHDDLVKEDTSKGKKCARQVLPKSEQSSGIIQPKSVGRTKRAASKKQQNNQNDDDATATATTENTTATQNDATSPGEPSEDDRLLSGAEALYALSLEAYGLVAQRQARRRIQTGGEAVKDPKNAVLDLTPDELHEYAKEKAREALETYKVEKEKAIEATVAAHAAAIANATTNNDSSFGNETADADVFESEMDTTEDKVANTKVQLYERKRAGKGDMD